MSTRDDAVALRNAFEAWAKDKGYRCTWLPPEDGLMAGYDATSTHHAWQGWRAALAAREGQAGAPAGLKLTDAMIDAFASPPVQEQAEDFETRAELSEQELVSVSEEREFLRERVRELEETTQTPCLCAAQSAQQDLQNLATWLAHKRAGTATTPDDGTLKRWVGALASARPTQPGVVEALRNTIAEVETLLTNLQPHIPQSCHPQGANFIDNYIDPALEKLRSALQQTDGGER